MRLPAACLALLVVTSACGGTDATGLARKACHAWDVYTDPTYHDEEQPKRLDIPKLAAEAAEKDDRFSPLSAAMAAWTATTQRQDALIGGNFLTMTATEKAKLSELDATYQRQVDALLAECKKARA